MQKPDALSFTSSLSAFGVLVLTIANNRLENPFIQAFILKIKLNMAEYSSLPHSIDTIASLTLHKTPYLAFQNVSLCRASAAPPARADSQRNGRCTSIGIHTKQSGSWTFKTLSFKTPSAMVSSSREDRSQPLSQKAVAFVEPSKRGSFITFDS
jgi:hypothetical protein